ncbi:MAG: hypothetical protein N3D11_01760 [Candidatus Sumerlaeia bacterium]|nr:hypothetical protein [Candidatus Sumerlaeia bacterium]
MREGLITDSQLTTALQVQKQTEKSLGRVLVEMGLITERVRMRLLQQRLGYDIVHINPQRIEQMVLEYLPKSVAVKHSLVPIKLDLDTLVVAMEDPTDVTVIDSLKTLTGFRIRPVIASIEEIEAVLKVYPEKEAPPMVIEAGPSRWFRTLGSVILVALLVLPFVAFYVYLQTNVEIQSRFAQPGAYVDVFIMTLLGYGIYAVVVYEVWALFFQSRKSKPPEPPVSLP